ncbi:unnamed protein product [Schistosoma mattheei]|uniref:Uncharacterized protein n=1 Tax=Schistosoma mattheei TaxID=31246 RepID=A0AA85BZQ6_9TREM|nr:unnamed protein product [Schistosoma mattheei]
MSLVEKINTLRLIIRQNGGIKGSFLTLFRTDELKWGKLVGTDNFGNKYYENNNYFVDIRIGLVGTMKGLKSHQNGLFIFVYFIEK